MSGNATYQELGGKAHCDLESVAGESRDCNAEETLLTDNCGLKLFSNSVSQGRRTSTLLKARATRTASPASRFR
jgi:hypothetical protein